MATERITVLVEMIDKISGKLKKVQTTTKDFNRTQGTLVETTRRLNESTNRQRIITRKSTTGVRSFNFAWLSVMFAGMALNRVFGSLIKSQLKLFGVTDLFSSVLTVVMLPVMEILLPLFIKLADVFFGLPDSVKLAIGVFIIFAFILGLILLVVGQVMLAFGGFVLLLTPAGAAGVAALMPILVIIGAVIIILIGLGLIIGGIVLIIKNWGQDWAKVAKGIVLVLAGIGIAILGVMILIGLLPFAWALVGVLVIAVVVGMVFAIINSWDKIVDALTVAWASIKNLFVMGWNFLISLWENRINRLIKLANLIPKVDIAPVDLSRFKGQLEDIEALRERLARQREVEAAARVIANARKAAEKEQEGGGFLSKIIPQQFQGALPGTTSNRTTQEININNNNTFNVSDKEEMEKLLNQNNINLVEEVKRQIAT